MPVTSAVDIHGCGDGVTPLTDATGTSVVSPVRTTRTHGSPGVQLIRWVSPAVNASGNPPRSLATVMLSNSIGVVTGFPRTTPPGGGRSEDRGRRGFPAAPSLPRS